MHLRQRLHAFQLYTTPITFSKTLATCLRLFVASPPPGDVVLMNGPGTCLPIVLAVFTARLLWRPAPRLVYVESFARVERFSLTARLVRPFVDEMLVQWPSLQRDSRGGWLAEAKYKGCLV